VRDVVVAPKHAEKEPRTRRKAPRKHRENTKTHTKKLGILPPSFAQNRKKLTLQYERRKTTEIQRQSPLATAAQAMPKG
jgi:hypothetical protein